MSVFNCISLNNIIFAKMSVTTFLYSHLLFVCLFVCLFFFSGCDQTITTDMSFVASPNSPNPYDINQECVYNITNPDGECINLIFLSFDLEAGRNGECVNDYLRVSTTKQANLFGKYKKNNN